MRLLLSVLVIVVAMAAVLLAVRGRARPEQRAAAVTASGPGEAWPCSAYSEEVAVESGPSWSYRLCGRGANNRRIELRFRRGAPADSLEYRLWLEQPIDCDATAGSVSRVIGAEGGAESMSDALSVAFTAYRGEVWLCARPLGGAAAFRAWAPRRARHGDAI